MAWGRGGEVKQECPRCGGESEVGAEVCPFCGRVMAEPIDSSITRREEAEKRLKPRLRYMPLLSIQCPLDWQYQALGLVTAQTVTGVGVLSDMTSFVTDALGRQSGMFTKKLQAGEDLCKQSLRMDALKAGGNAVIGVDIDYAEVGNMKMLMVCMTGTAIFLKNLDVLSSEAAGHLAEAVRIFTELRSIPT